MASRGSKSKSGGLGRSLIKDRNKGRKQAGKGSKEWVSKALTPLN